MIEYSYPLTLHLYLNFLCISVLVFGECFYTLKLRKYSSFEDIAQAYS